MDLIDEKHAFLSSADSVFPDISLAMWKSHFVIAPNVWGLFKFACDFLSGRISHKVGKFVKERTGISSARKNGYIFAEFICFISIVNFYDPTILSKY